MTKKRFILIDGVKKGTHSGIWDNLKQNNQRVGDELWVGEVVAMLNEGIAIVEENVKLKSVIKEVTELLSDEVDLFSDKATEHDIIAYEELKELDNKDAFYMATATKEAIKMLKELQE